MIGAIWTYSTLLCPSVKSDGGNLKLALKAIGSTCRATGGGDLWLPTITNGEPASCGSCYTARAIVHRESAYLGEVIHYYFSRGTRILRNLWHYTAVYLELGRSTLLRAPASGCEYLKFTLSHSGKCRHCNYWAPFLVSVRPILWFSGFILIRFYDSTAISSYGARL